VLGRMQVDSPNQCCHPAADVGAQFQWCPVIGPSQHAPENRASRPGDFLPSKARFAAGSLHGDAGPRAALVAEALRLLRLVAGKVHRPRKVEGVGLSASKAEPLTRGSGSSRPTLLRPRADLPRLARAIHRTDILIQLVEICFDLLAHGRPRWDEDAHVVAVDP